MDKLFVAPSKSSGGYRMLAVRSDDYDVFCELAESVNSKKVDLFSAMVSFCAARLEREEP